MTKTRIGKIGFSTGDPATCEIGAVSQTCARCLVAGSAVAVAHQNQGLNVG